MSSVSDLTTFSRKTSGDVPPKLVGASTTIVGDKVYLYGGRLGTESRMVTDMYVLDLKTLVWERAVAPADDYTPAQRYFHSADFWGQYLIIFGGMGLKPEANDNTQVLCVLSDVCFYNIPARRWMPPSWSIGENSLVPPPKPRYAHLSCVSGNRLFIIGGQNLDSVWLNDVYTYDLSSRAWILKRDYPHDRGMYRSVAVSADLRVHVPHEPTDDFPNEIFLYSNYDFTAVKRELEVLTPLSNGDFRHRDASSSINGPACPPGLRFPAGAILGTHLIIAGIYLAENLQSFAVWALDLIDMSWSRIYLGSALATGSWFRSGLWAKANKFIVFGNQKGNLVGEYNQRLLSWDHIAMIDLEAFGIHLGIPTLIISMG